MALRQQEPVVAGVRDQPPARLDEALLETGQRPAIHALRQHESPAQIPEVVREHAQLQPDFVGAEAVTRQSRPVRRLLPLLDPLLGRAPLVVEPRDGATGEREIRHDEADAREQLADVVLDLRIADYTHRKTGVAWISVSQLAADCSLTKPGVIGILRRLILHRACSVHGACASAVDALCPVCRTPLEQQGCLEVVKAQTGTRARRYRLVVNRLRGKGGLPLSLSAADSVGVNDVPLEVNGNEPTGQPGLPDPEVPKVPEEVHKPLGAVAPSDTQRDADDWFAECKRIDAGACGGNRMRHHLRKQTDAYKQKCVAGGGRR